MLLRETTPAPMHAAPIAPAVTARAPGRLHLGFLDPSGTLGRRFGGFGLVIDGFETMVSLAASARDELSADTPEARAELPRAARHLAALRERSGHLDPLHLRLGAVLPAHAGFGSGTQLAMAVGHAFARWFGLGADSATLATWLGRGARSGIGIAGFDQGGLLVDGGPSADGVPAPLLARLSLPADWRVIVVRDHAQRGLHGEAEKAAIARLPAFPREHAADVCHQVLMRVLPGAATTDFAVFAAGINQAQQLLGAHFAPAQGGSAFTSPAVGALMAWIEAVTADAPAAIGQSSWGPTGFAILPSQARAERLVDAARAEGLLGADLSARVVRPRNRGASVADTRAGHRPDLQADRHAALHTNPGTG